MVRLSLGHVAPVLALAVQSGGRQALFGEHGGLCRRSDSEVVTPGIEGMHLVHGSIGVNMMAVPSRVIGGVHTVGKSDQPGLLGTHICILQDALQREEGRRCLGSTSITCSTQRRGLHPHYVPKYTGTRRGAKRGQQVQPASAIDGQTTSRTSYEDPHAVEGGRVERRREARQGRGAVPFVLSSPASVSKPLRTDFP